MRVGIFDSGLGGLTVLKSVIKTLKGSDIFYIADTLYAPYGEKDTNEILARCDRITNYFLTNHSIDILIVACNTATSIAINYLREKFSSLIIIGTEPAIKPAILKTKSGNIGILATPTTINGDKYHLLLKELSNIKNLNILSQACPGLVEQIEKGEVKTLKTYSMLENWLKPMKRQNVDTIVLGCTHYPLVKEIIEDIMGKDTTLIDTGNAIAKRVLLLSKNINHINEGELSLSILYTSKINFDMVNSIIKGNKFKIRKCEI